MLIKVYLNNLLYEGFIDQGKIVGVDLNAWVVTQLEKAIFGGYTVVMDGDNCYTWTFGDDKDEEDQSGWALSVLHSVSSRLH